MDASFPGLALVDLDGTLLSVSSEKLFLQHLVKRRLLSIRRLVSFGLAYIFHPGKTVREGKGWNRTYLKGMQEDLIMSEAILFAERELCSRMRPAVLDIVRNLSAGGCRIIIVTASLAYLAEPVARSIDAHGVSASVPSVEKGILTGDISGIRPWGCDKAAAVQRICDHQDVAPSDCIALGDSWSDRYLMQLCGRAIAVHPAPGLRRLAMEKGWQIVNGRRTRWA